MVPQLELRMTTALIINHCDTTQVPNFFATSVFSLASVVKMSFRAPAIIVAPGPPLLLPPVPSHQPVRRC
jgi:hypothetical protein